MNGRTGSQTGASWSGWSSAVLAAARGASPRPGRCFCRTDCVTEPGASWARARARPLDASIIKRTIHQTVHAGYPTEGREGGRDKQSKPKQAGIANQASIHRPSDNAPSAYIRPGRRRGRRVVRAAMHAHAASECTQVRRDGERESDCQSRTGGSGGCRDRSEFKNRIEQNRRLTAGWRQPPVCPGGPLVPDGACPRGDPLPAPPSPLATQLLRLGHAWHSASRGVGGVYGVRSSPLPRPAALGRLESIRE